MPALTHENRRQDGADHETLALAYLEDLGYRLVRRNFQSQGRGEIDLIMRDGATYVFIEVKCRRNYRFGPPEEAIVPSKRRSMRRVAEAFLHVAGIKSCTARFDVVAVDYVTGRNGEPEIRHLIDAFP